MSSKLIPFEYIFASSISLSNSASSLCLPNKYSSSEQNVYCNVESCCSNCDFFDFSDSSWCWCVIVFDSGCLMNKSRMKSA